MGLSPWPGSSGDSDQIFPSRAWGRSSSSLAPPVHPTGSSRRGFSPVLSPLGLVLRGPCLLVAPRPDVGVPTRVSSVPREGGRSGHPLVRLWRWSMHASRSRAWYLGSGRKALASLLGLGQVAGVVSSDPWSRGEGLFCSVDISSARSSSSMLPGRSSPG